MQRVIRITAPSRLHFGLLSFANQAGRSYGGLGLMIAEPCLAMEMSLANEWKCWGEDCERSLNYAQQAVSELCQADPGAMQLRILKKPEAHSGLGSGTQLALSIAAGVHTLTSEGPYDLEEIVSAMSRGKRSSVGSHGFQLGGLIWETGKLPQQTLGELAKRVALPEGWRVVLIRLPGKGGLHGESENDAFGALPSIEKHVTDRLVELAEKTIVPAAESGDCDQFSEGIYQYGLLAGSCFETIQASPFVSQEVEQAVDTLRGLGVRGVGQSSWGPTIFAFCPDQNAAAELVARLRGLAEFSSANLTISAPCNEGARLEVMNEVLQ